MYYIILTSNFCFILPRNFGRHFMVSFSWFMEVKIFKQHADGNIKKNVKLRATISYNYYRAHNYLSKISAHAGYSVGHFFCSVLWCRLNLSNIFYSQYLLLGRGWRPLVPRESKKYMPVLIYRKLVTLWGMKWAVIILRSHYSLCVHT